MREITKDEEERVRFAVFAIEAAAAKSGVPAWELYARLERLDLVRRRLFEDYPMLHTQGRDYIADDLLETLANWEAAARQKGGGAW